MPKMLRLLPAAVLTAAALCGPVLAEPLRCRSINGNVSCVGPGAASCQTVDGRTVCMSRDGDAVQVFGNGQPPADIPEVIEDDEAGEDDASSLPPSFRLPPASLRSMSPRLSIERHDAAGGRLVLRREGRKLHIRTDRLVVDVE